VTGDRGAGWVVAQFVLMGAVLAAGLVPPHWPGGDAPVRVVVGGVVAIGGLALAVWAGRTLGRSLTPFPKPVPEGLVTSGPFARVRHPIYSGGILLFAGYSLATSAAALLLTVSLAALWAGKLRLEERLLLETYAGYDDYRRRVRWRLCPWIY
jgi:protein-S-isoprenylcysteine O-methyltransferase Ste14